MTKEEAIKILKELPNNILGVVLPFDIDFDYTQALDIAINALEQETVSKESYDHEYFLRKELDFKVARLEKQIAEQQHCEDAVSRQSVLDELRTCFDTHSIYDENNGENYIIYEDAVDMMEKLPHVTPTRPKAQWIRVHYIDGNNDTVMNKCSNCQTEFGWDIETGISFEDYLYCPNCGAEMSGEQVIGETNEAEWEYFTPQGYSYPIPRCSKCHEWGYTKWDIKTPYCPYCGKKMKNGIKYFDGEDNNG